MRRLAIAFGLTAALGLAALAVAQPPASASEGDANTLPGPLLVHSELRLLDTQESDGDLVFEPGEAMGAVERVQNTGDAAATNVRGVLTGGELRVRQGVSPWPDIPVSGAGSNSTPFELALALSYPCGKAATLILNLDTSSGPQPTIRVPIPVGRPSAPVARDSTHVPLDIPDLGTVESVLTISETGRIADVNVKLASISHTFDADLRISLVGPDGQTAVLVNRRGQGENFVGTTFDDEAITSILVGSPPFTGSFKPEQPLSVFDGGEQRGTWRLRIEDLDEFDTGRLNAWGTVFTTATCNIAPRALFGRDPESPAARQVVTFDSQSVDPDGSIAGQAWDLDNDGDFDDGTDAVARHAFPAPGTYTVSLRVTDNGGESATASEEVKVVNPRAAKALCRVPRVVGLKLPAARSRIRRAHCRVGRVRRARSRQIGRVVAQSPRPGTRRPAGARVSLVVGRR